MSSHDFAFFVEEGGKENLDLGTMVIKWEERSQGRVTKCSRGEMLSKRENIAKSHHIYNLILSLNIPEAGKLALIIFIFQNVPEVLKG